jgi:hypothetical protein
MNDGIFNLVLSNPFTIPAMPPNPTVMGIIQSPTSLEFILLCARNPTKTTHNATTPSTDKSIPPKTTTW